MYPCTAAAEEGLRYAVTVGMNEEQSRGQFYDWLRTSLQRGFRDSTVYS